VWSNKLPQKISAESGLLHPPRLATIRHREQETYSQSRYRFPAAPRSDLLGAHSAAGRSQASPAIAIRQLALAPTNPKTYF
jgi:hypothetical protein